MMQICNNEIFDFCTSEHTMRMGKKKEELQQTSPGTLYFFITIPVSQSITQRESPPQVATKRLSPAAPVSKETQFQSSERSERTVVLSLSGGTWLEGAGPQLGGEVLRVVLFTVTLEDVERLQTHRLQEEGRTFDDILTIEN